MESSKLSSDMTIAELCDLVKEKNVSIEIIMAMDETRIEIYPYRDFRPLCPYRKDGE